MHLPYRLFERHFKWRFEWLPQAIDGTVWLRDYDVSELLVELEHSNVRGSLNAFGIGSGFAFLEDGPAGPSLVLFCPTFAPWPTLR